MNFFKYLGLQLNKLFYLVLRTELIEIVSGNKKIDEGNHPAADYTRIAHHDIRIGVLYSVDASLKNVC